MQRPAASGPLSAFGVVPHTRGFCRALQPRVGHVPRSGTLCEEPPTRCLFTPCPPQSSVGPEGRAPDPGSVSPSSENGGFLVPAFPASVAEGASASPSMAHGGRPGSLRGGRVWFKSSTIETPLHLLPSRLPERLPGPSPARAGGPA